MAFGRGDAAVDAQDGCTAVQDEYGSASSWVPCFRRGTVGKSAVEGL